nr:hypothetical protein [Tanacetum cinerariifolium]
MEILDTMISDAIKKSVGYNFYIAKKNESAKDKIVDEPEEQRSIASRLESLKQKKQAVTGEGSSNAHNKHYADSNTNSDTILYASCSEESKNETDDADDSDMDLSDDNPESDDDEMFSDENAHHIPHQPAKKIPYTATTPQPSSLQATAKKLMQKKLEALTNFNVSKAFEKVVQARVLKEIKKLLPTHISKAIANYEGGLTIADLEVAGLEKIKQQHKNDIELEYHVEQLKETVLTEAKWNSDEDEV